MIIIIITFRDCGPPHRMRFSSIAAHNNCAAVHAVAVMHSTLYRIYYILFVTLLQLRQKRARTSGRTIAFATLRIRHSDCCQYIRRYSTCTTNIYIWHRSYRELPHFRVRMMPIGCRRNVVYHDRRVWPNVSLSRSHTNTFWWKIHCYQLSALHWAQRVWLRRVCVLSNCLRYSMRSNGGSMKHTMNTEHRVRIAKGVSLPSHTGSFALPLAHTFRFLVVVVFMPTPTHTHTHTPATMCIAALPPYIALAFNCTRYNLVNDDIKRVVGIYVFAVAQCAEAE